MELLKYALKNLTEQLRPQDRAAVVTYCGDASVLLHSTSGNDKRTILKKIQKLAACGSTNGSGGIELAYKEAQKNFNHEAINRVILCSDGDFNVGAASLGQMETQIEEAAKSGVFLTVLGVGMGNFKDNRMELLADRGNGLYAYIDSKSEADRVLVKELSGTLAVIAKDVKIQIDFNPATVASYRLIGYENRKLADEDFHDDRKDAGEIGAGHRVAALYEIVPTGVENPFFVPPTDESRYAADAEPESETAAEPETATESETASEPETATESETASEPETVAESASETHSDELFLVKLRWKQPAEESSLYRDFPVTVPTEAQLSESSDDFQFTAGAALFAEILRESAFTNGAGFETVEKLTRSTHNAEGKEDEKRAEFRRLLEAAQLPARRN